MVTNIIDAVASLPGKMADVGVNVVKGVWNGITGMGSWLADKVSGFFTGIVDGAKDALGIHSPSRVFRDQIGAMMAKGVGVGFEDESKNIQHDMKNNLSDLTAKMQATVDYETAKTTARVVASSNYKNNPQGAVITNDNGITQNIKIVSPQNTPSENARLVKKAGRDLIYGL